jgi:hypothetical protein
VSYWKAKSAAAGEQVKRLVVPFFAFVSRGEEEPPERPHVFRIIDEDGNEREVFAPPGPGQVTHWRW